MRFSLCLGVGLGLFTSSVTAHVVGRSKCTPKQPCGVEPQPVVPPIGSQSQYPLSLDAELEVIPEGTTPCISSAGTLVYSPAESCGNFVLSDYDGITPGGGTKQVLQSELGICDTQTGKLLCPNVSTTPEPTFFTYTDNNYLITETLPEANPPKKWKAASDLAAGGFVYPPAATAHPRHPAKFHIKVNGL